MLQQLQILLSNPGNQLPAVGFLLATKLKNSSISIVHMVTGFWNSFSSRRLCLDMSVPFMNLRFLSNYGIFTQILSSSGWHLATFWDLLIYVHDIGSCGHQSSLCWLLQACCVEYIILESDNLSSLFPNAHLNFGVFDLNSRHLFALIATLAVLPTVMLRDLSVLSYISGESIYFINL